MHAVGALWAVAGMLLVSGPAAAPSRPLEPDTAMEQAPGEFREGHYTDDYGTRRYRLYLPSSVSSEGRPMVVMLHGCTQDPEDFAAGTRANEHAAIAGALVLYPEQPESAHPQKCWSWFDPTHQRRGAGEPALLAGMTRQVAEENGADPERIYVAGISAGGSMAQILTAAYPELYRGLAVHSAPAAHSATDIPTALAVLEHGVVDPEALADRVLDVMGEGARPVPTLVLHGEDDSVVRVVNGEQAFRQWAGVALHAGVQATARGGLAEEAKGCPLVPGLSVETFRVKAAAPARRCVYHGAPVALEYWAMEGMGHAWSGGSELGSYTDPAGPDATAHVFRFFLGVGEMK